MNWAELESLMSQQAHAQALAMDADHAHAVLASAVGKLTLEPENDDLRQMLNAALQIIADRAEQQWALAEEIEERLRTREAV